MTTFAEIIGNVEKKNDLQRQVLAQLIQPFFAAMQAQANYKEQKKRADAEMAERNAKYYNDQQELSKTGVPTPDMSANVQEQYWQKRYSEKTRTEGLRNQIQQLGMEDQYNLFMKNNPNADIDTAWSVVSKFVDAETIDKSAKTLGTEGYKMYQTILAKTKDPATALADTKNAMAEKEAQAKYQQDLALIYARKDGDGGESSGSTATPTQDANTKNDIKTATTNIDNFKKNGYVYISGQNSIVAKQSQVKGKLGWTFKSTDDTDGWSYRAGEWYDPSGNKVKRDKGNKYSGVEAPIIRRLILAREAARSHVATLQTQYDNAKNSRSTIVGDVTAPATDTGTNQPSAELQALGNKKGWF